MFPHRKESFEHFALEAAIVPPGSTLPVHTHERAHVVLVFAGEVYDGSSKDMHRVAPGELLLRPAHMTHANHVGARGAHLINIDIMPSLAAAFEPFYGPSWASARLTFPMLRHLPEQLRAEMAAADRLSMRILPGLVEQLLGNGARSLASAGQPPWLREAVALLDQSIASGTTIQQVARRVGVSESRLSHAFREHAGRSVGAYVRELRVEAAARALRETDEPIAAIAAACGFADQAHLSRTFRACRGMTPMEYRRAQRV
ncbi:MAG TPA: AraC family transcriptional regulator [Thermoanaerobaculia bacterium]|jgi:AraC-like DNA-binding protein